VKRAVKVGIPTKYNGTQFRSRLEARWAAFFDLLEWEWEYEPFDLAGYIPDFVLCFKQPLLVEVKPAIQPDELGDAFDKIWNSGWNKEAIVVGAKLFSDDWSQGLQMGQLLGGFALSTWGDVHDSENTHGARTNGSDAAALFGCGQCKRASFCHVLNSYQCRASGCWDGDHQLSGGPDFDWLSLWREAGNQVQWRGVDARPLLRGRPGPASNDPKLGYPEVSSFFGNLADMLDD